MANGGQDAGTGHTGPKISTGATAAAGEHGQEARGGAVQDMAAERAHDSVQSRAEPRPGLIDAIGNATREQPLLFVAAALGVGYLLGQLLRREHDALREP